MYKVIRAFTDSTDNNRLYVEGDTYPVEGAKVSKSRINSLLTGSNKNGKVYLEEFEEPDLGIEGESETSETAEEDSEE